MLKPSRMSAWSSTIATLMVMVFSFGDRC
jgi:hypothetical protein